MKLGTAGSTYTGKLASVWVCLLLFQGSAAQPDRVKKTLDSKLAQVKLALGQGWQCSLLTSRTSPVRQACIALVLHLGRHVLPS